MHAWVILSTVADPGFLRVGMSILKGCVEIAKKITENCMRMKEFGTMSLVPPPPGSSHWSFYLIQVIKQKSLRLKQKN